MFTLSQGCLDRETPCLQGFSCILFPLFEIFMAIIMHVFKTLTVCDDWCCRHSASGSVSCKLPFHLERGNKIYRCSCMFKMGCAWMYLGLHINNPTLQLFLVILAPLVLPYHIHKLINLLYVEAWWGGQGADFQLSHSNYIRVPSPHISPLLIPCSPLSLPHHHLCAFCFPLLFPPLMPRSSSPPALCFP